MKIAQIFRMVTPEHICPFGTKSKYLLESKGYRVEDHHLKTRTEADDFKAQHQVQTTPQTFIDGKRIGGYDDLRTFFGKRPAPKKGEVSYAPVVSVFGVALLVAFAIDWMAFRELRVSHLIQTFGGLSMCFLAAQKLKDLFAFTNSFLNYDLLAMRYVPYSYVYPFAELVAGLGMLSGLLTTVAAGLAILLGLEGTVSVVKAVYVDERELHCACVGGDTKVPLGFVSLLENVLMVGMGVWMTL